MCKEGWTAIGKAWQVIKEDQDGCVQPWRDAPQNKNAATRPIHAGAETTSPAKKLFSQNAAGEGSPPSLTGVSVNWGSNMRDRRFLMKGVSTGGLLRLEGIRSGFPPGSAGEGLQWGVPAVPNTEKGEKT